MAELLTNETNLESLKDAVSKAKKEIVLISAWMRSETLRKIFTEDIINRAKKKNIKIYIVIRLSGIDDLKITDEGVFKFAEEVGEIYELRYNKTLHTKLYIVDDTYASVGSFNLTGGGFGNEDRAGSNIETGLKITNNKEITSLKNRAKEIWKNSTKIPYDLIGFTLNGTTHYNYTIVGIKPLETGKFVEIREDANTVILGQIGEVRKFNFSFYNPPESGEYDEYFADTFSNLNSLSNKLKGIAVASNLEYGQLNIANVHILARFYIKKKDDKIVNLQKDDNRFAPDVGCEVFTASEDILKSLFYNENCHPAILNSNREVEVGLNPNEILSKHMAVFGTTGSGKSFFVKYLISDFLGDYITKEKKGRIIIFDPHGEYAKDLKKKIKNFKVLNKKDWGKYLTFYIESVDDLINYFGLDRRQSLTKDIINVFNSSQNISDKNISKILTKNKIPNEFVKIVEDAVNDDEISFDQLPDCWKDFKDNKIYCVNLRECDEIEDMWSIVSNIMSSIFNHAKSTQKFPTLFVIEEAHNFAPEGADRNNEAAIIIRKIAREGRKFDNGLIVITQRPAYVSKDVLTQCSTQAIFRLINGNDIGAVSEVVEGIGQNEAVRLPHYIQGQCIFTGVAIDSSVVVRVEE